MPLQAYTRHMVERVADLPEHVLGFRATGTITAYVEVGGSVGVGSYTYKTTFTSARGETLGSAA